jgi:hypothetical protein
MAAESVPMFTAWAVTLTTRLAFCACTFACVFPNRQIEFGWMWETTLGVRDGVKLKVTKMREDFV